MSECSRKHEPENLSVAEKIRRVQDLWDEIARSPADVELTPEQLAEVERRLARHERIPGTYATWEDLRRRLEQGR